MRQRNNSQLLHVIFLQQAQLVKGDIQNSGKQSSTSAGCTGDFPWRFGLEVTPGMILAERGVEVK